jgi:hypothetical protein
MNITSSPLFTPALIAVCLAAMVVVGLHYAKFPYTAFLLSPKVALKSRPPFVGLTLTSRALCVYSLVCMG